MRVIVPILALVLVACENPGKPATKQLTKVSAAVDRSTAAVTKAQENSDRIAQHTDKARSYADRIEYKTIILLNRWKRQ